MAPSPISRRETTGSLSRSRSTRGSAPEEMLRARWAAKQHQREPVWDFFYAIFDGYAGQGVLPLGQKGTGTSHNLVGLAVFRNAEGRQPAEPGALPGDKIANAAVTVSGRQSAPAARPAVWPSTGWRQSGAISASGASTKARSCMRGCGSVIVAESSHEARPSRRCRDRACARAHLLAALAAEAALDLQTAHHKAVAARAPARLAPRRRCSSRAGRCLRPGCGFPDT